MAAHPFSVPFTKPAIAILQGDPAGIGPELLVKLLNSEDVRSDAKILVIGDPGIFRRGERVVGRRVAGMRSIAIGEAIEFSGNEVLHLDMSLPGIAETAMSQVSTEGGQASLNALCKALELSQSEGVHGILFLPFNKASMQLGGNPFPDEISFARAFLKVTGPVGEFNVAHDMWNGRVTSHVAMRDVPRLLTRSKIMDGIALADQTLRLAGRDRPRIAVAAYNPHAGDGGLMGREEIDVIGPAVKSMQARQVNVEGPFPADTLWLKMRNREYDVVVSMYHDQGQIAIKLLGFDQGVSVLAGLPIPIVTPAHGTAFDIAGQNKARVTPTRKAFDIVVEMARQHMSATA